MVRVDFQCKQCGSRWETEVEPTVWTAVCACGGEARRLIQVHFVMPSVQREENLSTLKALNESVEPSAETIRRIHRFKYNEEPTREVIRDVQRHKLVTW